MEQPTTKAKKVLTEAQRLAFLKGREKRLANIETKRMEKVEAMENATQEDAPPKVKPKTKAKPEPVPPVETKQEEPEPEPESEPEPKVEEKPIVEPPNIDAIVQQVMSRIKKQEEVSPPVKTTNKRPYVRRPTPTTISQTPPDSPPPPTKVPTRDFNWM